MRGWSTLGVGAEAGLELGKQGFMQIGGQRTFGISNKSQNLIAGKEGADILKFNQSMGGRKSWMQPTSIHFPIGMVFVANAAVVASDPTSKGEYES